MIESIIATIIAIIVGIFIGIMFAFFYFRAKVESRARFVKMAIKAV
jgi:ABC-type phosphate transport system permease subunit